MASTVDTTAVALRGGDHTASLNFVGIAKELVADMGTSGDGTDATTTTLRLHNGITTGGIPMMRADTMNMSTRVLAEGRKKLGDKNLAYSDLANLEETYEQYSRENMIQVLNASTVWTDLSLLLATRKNLQDEIDSTKTWVNTHYVACTNPGAPYAKPSNTVAIPTTFSNTFTTKSTTTINNTSGSIELVPDSNTSTGGFLDFHFAGSSSDYTSRIIEDGSGQVCYLGSARGTATASTSSAVIATKGWVNDSNASTNIVHRSGAEPITGDKTCTGVIDITGGTTRVKTAPASSNDTTAASTAYVTSAIAASAANFVTIATSQTVTGSKQFNSASVQFVDPEDPDNPRWSSVASTDYVDWAISKASGEYVMTSGINWTDKAHPSTADVQNIYGDITFAANNAAEIAEKRAQLLADKNAGIITPEQYTTYDTALANLAVHNCTTTFNDSTVFTGSNTWSNTTTNVFNGTVNMTGAVTATGTVQLNGTTTGVTPGATDNSTKLATTAWVSNYAMKIQPVISKFANAPNGAVTLQYNTKIYVVTGTVSAFTFNTSNLGTLANDEALEFKLFIPSTTNASAQNIWPASVRFLNEEAPTLATGRNYVATLFSIDKGTTWWLAMSGWNYALWG